MKTIAASLKSVATWLRYEATHPTHVKTICLAGLFIQGASARYAAGLGGVQSAFAPQPTPPNSLGNAPAPALPPAPGEPGGIQGWQWREVAGAVCGNGEPTGYAVNFQGDKSEIFINLEGGGECDSFVTCYEENLASYATTGYNSTTFFDGSDELPTLTYAMPITERTNPQNPFRHMSLAYVPYCTGDVHAGNATVQYAPGPYAFHHVGAVNMQLFLEDLHGLVPKPKRIVLGGSSAGGLGSVLNMQRTAEVFPHSRVDVLDDSGLDFSSGTAVPPWNVPYPTYCKDECLTDFAHLLLSTAKAYPKSSIAVLAYTQDDVLPLYQNLTESEFAQHLEACPVTTRSAKNLHYFFVDAASHEVLLNISQTTDGVTVAKWLEEFHNHSHAWKNRLV